jgi:hypothetical protein
MTVRAALAFSIAGSGSHQVTSALSDLGWVLTVIVSFPAAMFVMSGAFGLQRAGIISKRFFSAGVLAVVLVLLGGTTFTGSRNRCSIARSIFVWSFAASCSSLSKRTFPLAMKVETSSSPSSSVHVFRSVILISVFPPTLIPLRSATYLIR